MGPGGDLGGQKAHFTDRVTEAWTILGLICSTNNPKKKNLRSPWAKRNQAEIWTLPPPGSPTTHSPPPSRWQLRAMDLPGGDDGVPGICGLEEEKVSAPSLQATRAGGPRGRSVGAGIHGALPAGRPHQEKFVRRKSSRKCRARGAARPPWASALGSELGRSLGALSLHPPPGSRPRPLRSRVETPFPRGLAGAAEFQLQHPSFQ